ncbi:hypothetical protein ACFQV8_32335 [Pseudonocardia benzenivorans]
MRKGDVRIANANPLPVPPAAAEEVWSNGTGTSYMEDTIATPDVGAGDAIDRITFLLPNGWKSLDGGNIRDGSRPWLWRRGRLEIDSGAWKVTIDPRPGLSSAFWKELKASGSSAVTHIGEIRRSDGSTFAAIEAESIMNVTRLAIGFAIGRATQCLLPVGWRGDVAVWTRWHTGGIDRMQSVQSILDETEAVEQLQKILIGAFNFAIDDYTEEILQYSISYYLSANYDVNVEIAVALAISGLQMLSYYKLMEERKAYSNTAWKNMSTYDQIKAYLTSFSVDLTIPSTLSYLVDVQTALGPRDGSQRDGLQCVIDMRNSVIHPTREKPARWTSYQWAEASHLALDYLRFAILDLLGYSGGARTAAQQEKWVGSLTPMPWDQP